MRIAIATEGQFVAEHFGRCPAFTVVEIVDGSIASCEVIENPGHQPGFIPRFLYDRGVKCVIAGGMGPRAMDLFHQLGMEAIVGIEGTVNDAIARFAQGTLSGGQSLCQPGLGKGYGMEKSICDHHHEEQCERK